MTLTKLFKQNLILITGIIGFATGSLGSSAYHLKQIKEERKTFFECQQAWEKYYTLTKEKTSPNFNLAKQIDRKIRLDSLTNKLNHYGWEMDQETLEDFINRSFNHSLELIAYKIPQLVPFLSYYTKYWESKQISQEKLREKLYYSEVLPKCQKIKDWEKEVDKLINQG